MQQERDLASPAAIFARVGRSGLWLTLGLVFLIDGLQGFTPYQARAVHALAQGHPLVDWCYRLWGVRGASVVFGLIEVPIALGLLSGVWRPGGWPAKAGAAGAALICALTVSFLFTAPGVIAARTVLDLPLLSLPVGQFLFKDTVLLAASLILLGEGGRR